MNQATKSDVIQLAWADDISFETIEKRTGLREKDVIRVMRQNLKPGSFRLWRKRVSGRKSKHAKRLRESRKASAQRVDFARLSE